MKTSRRQHNKPTRKSLMYLFFLLCSLTLFSYRSIASNANFTYSAGTADSNHCNIHANFTYTLGANGLVTFTNTSTGQIGGYNWNMGDGAGYSTNASLVYTYALNGTYNVTLWVGSDSSYSCTDSIMETIHVTNADSNHCNIHANFTYTLGANGLVTFTNTSTGQIGGYNWNMGDGAGYSTNASLVYTYALNGTYNVTLWVGSDSSYSCTDSIMETIHVTNADSNHCNIHANFTYTLGANGLVTFTNTSTGQIGGYNWNMGDGAGYSTNASLVYTYALNGTYNVTLWVGSDSSYSCTDSIMETIHVTNADSNHCNIHANFTYTLGTNGQVTFTNTSTGQIGWDNWYMGDVTGLSHSNTSFVYTYAFNGTYNVTLYIGSDSSYSCTDSIMETIHVTNADSNHCNIHANFTYTLGANGLVTFTNTSTGQIGGYNWNMGDGAGYSTNASLVYTYALNGTYNVTLWVGSDSSYSCTDSIMETIHVTDADSNHCNIHANFTYTLGTNGQVTFTNTSTGQIGWDNWYMGDVTGLSHSNTSFVYTYAFNGTYNVTLYIGSDSSYSCTDSIMETIHVTDADSNQCNMNVNFTYQYDSVGQVKFKSTSTGVDSGARYIWSFGDSTAINGYDTATHRYSFIGSHNVTLTIVNPGGCIDSTIQTIYNSDSVVSAGIQSLSEVSARYTIYPNPNNGEFKITVSGLENGQNAEIRITNMMGQVIYQSTAAAKGGISLSDINLNAANGIYLLQIIAGNNTYTSRIAVQR